MILREPGYAACESEDAQAAMGSLRGGEAADPMVTGIPVTGCAVGADADVTLESGIPVLAKRFTLAALASRIGELLAVRRSAVGS